MLDALFADSRLVICDSHRDSSFRPHHWALPFVRPLPGVVLQDTAGVAAVAAVVEQVAALAAFVILAKKRFSTPLLQVIPGQHFVDLATAVEIEYPVDAGFLDGALPRFHRVPFVPGVEARAVPPRGLDDGVQAPVAAR